MRGFYRYLNAELARRCLVMPDASHGNYWGLAAPATLLGVVGSFVAALCLADDRLHGASFMIGLYAAWVGITSALLGARTPASQPVPGIFPTLAVLARWGAAVFPLALETAITFPLLCWLAGWQRAGELAILLALLVTVPALLGLLGSARQWETAATVGFSGMVGVAMSVFAAEMAPRLAPLGPYGGQKFYVALMLGFVLTMVAADCTGQTARLDPQSEPLQADLPDGPSWRWGVRCGRQALGWGLKPFPWLHIERWQGCWYAIGLYTTLVLGLTFSIRLAQVSVRNADELASCQRSQATIAAARSNGTSTTTTPTRPS